MSPQDLLEALVALARELGLEVRRVPPGGEAETASGVCRLRERIWVLLSPSDPPARRAEVLAAALRDHAGDALESRYLPPAVRVRLESATSRDERSGSGAALSGPGVAGMP